MSFIVHIQTTNYFINKYEYLAAFNSITLADKTRDKFMVLLA